MSYVLHGAGLLKTALDSSGFMSWGEPGPGDVGHPLRQPRPLLHGHRRPAVRHQRPRRGQLPLGHRRCGRPAATPSATQPVSRRPRVRHGARAAPIGPGPSPPMFGWRRGPIWGTPCGMRRWLMPVLAILAVGGGACGGDEGARLRLETPPERSGAEPLPEVRAAQERAEQALRAGARAPDEGRRPARPAGPDAAGRARCGATGASGPRPSSPCPPSWPRARRCGWRRQADVRALPRLAALRRAPARRSGARAATSSPPSA